MFLIYLYYQQLDAVLFFFCYYIPFQVTCTFLVCRFGKKKAVYKGYWSTPEDFQSILVSNLMLYDHYPDALIGALSSILHEDVEEEMNGALGEREDTLIDNGSASINILAGNPNWCPICIVYL